MPASSRPQRPSMPAYQLLPTITESSSEDEYFPSLVQKQFVKQKRLLRAQHDVITEMWREEHDEHRKIFIRYLELPRSIKTQLADKVITGFDVLEMIVRTLQEVDLLIGDKEQEKLIARINDMHRQLANMHLEHDRQKLALDHIEQQVEADGCKRKSKRVRIEQNSDDALVGNGLAEFAPCPQLREMKLE